MPLLSHSACANRVAETVRPGAPHKPLPADIADQAIARLDKLRHAKGDLTTAAARRNMQKIMQSDAAVFRTQSSLEEGCGKIDQCFDNFKANVGIKDRSLVWNTDLVETLELENLLINAQVGSRRRCSFRRDGLGRARRNPPCHASHAMLGSRGAFREF